MRFKVVVLIFTLLGFQSFSQSNEWKSYDMDSIVSIDLPGEVHEIDTIIDYQKVYILFSSIDSVDFSVDRLFLGKLFSNIKTAPLPKNEEDLQQLYRTIANAESIIRQQESSFSRIMNRNNLVGYRLVFEKNENHPYSERYLIFFNKNLYSFKYEDPEGLNLDYRNSFFDSINVGSDHQLKQLYGQPSILNRTTITILLIFLAASILLRRKNKRRARK